MTNSSFYNHQDLPIAIVGGGLGGLALAVGLLKRNVKVRIYEAAAKFSEIGAGVAFGPNAVRALNLIDTRLLEGYKRHATFNENPELQDTFLSLRYGIDSRSGDEKKAGDLIAHVGDNQESTKALGVRTRSCIHRARLLDELVALLPEGITRFGKSLKEIVNQEDGVLALQFADGSTAQASAVIGCDGINSKARKAVCGDKVHPKYVNEYAFRAMVPKSQAVRELGPELALNGQLYCGYGAYIVTYPVEHGEFTNMVAIPRETDSSLKNGTHWTIKHGSNGTAPVVPNEIQSRFEGWVPKLVNLICKYALTEKWAMLNLEHTEKYYKGRICLMGDSAHATTPHMGAGAGMAMEDAYVLSDLIASVKGPEEIEKAFCAYDIVRRPRTQTLVRYSELAGIECNFLMPGIEDNVELLAKDLSAKYLWLWHEDLEAQLKAAKELL